MNTALNKEVKQNPALLAMFGKQDEEPKETVKKEKVVKPKDDWRKKNPRGAKRDRGKNGSIPMSYYLPPEIIRCLNIAAATRGLTKSQLVLEGLQIVLKEELKAEKHKKKGENE